MLCFALPFSGVLSSHQIQGFLHTHQRSSRHCPVLCVKCPCLLPSLFSYSIASLQSVACVDDCHISVHLDPSPQIRILDVCSLFLSARPNLSVSSFPQLCLVKLRPCINYLFKCVIRNHFRRVCLFWLPVFRGTVYLSGEGVAAEMWGSWTRGRELDRNWALAVKSWGPWPTTPSNALLPKQVPLPSKPASPTGDEVLKHLSLWGHCTLKPEEAPDTSRHRVIIAHFL